MSLTLLKLGRLWLPTLDKDKKEGVGEPLDTTGAGVALGQRRPKPFAFTAPLLAMPGATQEDLVALGNSYRRRLRSMLQNPALRGQGLYLTFLADPEINGWVMLGNGQIADADGGVGFGNFILTLDESYKVASRWTHQPARRALITDRRLAATPRDTLEQVFGTDFATQAALSLTFLPPGVTAISNSSRTPIASGILQGADGSVTVIPNVADLDVLSFEQPEQFEGRADVAMLDRQGVAAPPPRTITLDDASTVTRIEGFGHSYMAGVGVTAGQRFLTLVGNDYGVTPIDDGVGGTTVQGNLPVQLAGALARNSGDVMSQVALVMWGINDIGYLSTSTAGYFAAMVAAVSRIRTLPGEAHSYTDAAFSYGTGWSVVGGFKATSTNGSTFTWTSPAGFPGGTIAIELAAENAQGGTFTFTGAGGGQVVNTTTLPPAALSGYVACVVRFKLPAGAGQVISCVVSSITTGAYIAGWQRESPTPPLVALVKQPRAYSYATYVGSVHVPTDADVAAFNVVVDQVAAVFDGYVVTVDTDSVMRKLPANFQADGLHPSVQGNVLIAQAIEAAIQASVHITGQSSLWEEFYGADYPLTPDVPVLDNSLARVRWDSTSGSFVVERYTVAGGYLEHGRVVILNAVGGAYVNHYSLIAASVGTWTPERAVVKVTLQAINGTLAEVYITLQRGWACPRFEVYTDAGTVAAIEYVSASGGHHALCGAGVVVISDFDTWGALAGRAFFTGQEPWASVQPLDITLPAVVLIPTVEGTGLYTVTDAYGIYGAGSNHEGVLFQGTGAYCSMQVGAHDRGGVLEAEAVLNGTDSTASVVTDAAASGGQAVQETSGTGAYPLYVAVSPMPDLGRCQIWARVRLGAAPGGAQGVVYGLDSATGGTTGLTLITSGTFVWVKMAGAELYKTISPSSLYVGAYQTAGAVSVRLDRILVVPTERRVGGDAQYDFARDQGQASLMDCRQIPTFVER